MGKQRMRNWILNNQFFQTKGQFSKTAFICMNTWFTVMLKYITAGQTFGIATTEKIIAGKVIPAFSWSWVIGFDYMAATALLTVVFTLYFGNKWNSTKENSNGNSQENPAITK